MILWFIEHYNSRSTKNLEIPVEIIKRISLYVATDWSDQKSFTALIPFLSLYFCEESWGKEEQIIYHVFTDNEAEATN